MRVKLVIVQTETRVAEILDIVRRVCALGEYDSNIIGMAAEIIAEDVFGMTKVSRGTKDIDGYIVLDELRHTVQVKAWSEARIKKYKFGTFLRIKTVGEIDKLLVILVRNSKLGYEVIYNGSPNDVGYLERDGKNRVIRFDAIKSRVEIQTLLDDL